MNEHVILFLGNSLTEGYRLAARLAFPERLVEKFAQNGRSVRAINAGVAGHTTGDALRRLPLLLDRRADAAGRQHDETITDLVIELGVNDLLQRVPLATVRENLLAIIQAARVAFPRIRIFLFRVPALSLSFEFLPDGTDALSQGEADEYAHEFAAIYPQLAAEDKQLILLPFLLDGVLMRPEYNQPDLIHPNPRGQELVVENFWRSLKDYF